MADDMVEIVVPFQNRSSDPPASSIGYNFKVLSRNQQKDLNDLKIRTVRENHVYLNEHPEIPALLTLLLTAVFTSKPRNARDFLAAYIKRPRLQLAVEALVEKQQRLSTEKSSVERETSSPAIAKPPLGLANIVFPSSLKVEDYQVQEIEEVDKEAVIIAKDIMNEILSRVEETITEKENYRMAKDILTDVVTGFKPTMYPPCEPKLYRHSTSEEERQAKEPIFVVEGIKDDILTGIEESIILKEDTLYIKELLEELLPKAETSSSEQE